MVSLPQLTLMLRHYGEFTTTNRSYWAMVSLPQLTLILLQVCEFTTTNPCLTANFSLMKCIFSELWMKVSPK